MFQAVIAALWVGGACVTAFVVVPQMGSVVAESRRQQEQAKTLSDAAEVLVEREAQILKQERELNRLQEANLDLATKLRELLKDKP